MQARPPMQMEGTGLYRDKTGTAQNSPTVVSDGYYNICFHRLISMETSHTQEIQR